jgi:hypothetical protein
MQRKQAYQALSVALLLAGAILIAYPEPSITGAVTGTADFTGINPLIGVILVTLAGALVIASKQENPGQDALNKLDKNLERITATTKTMQADYMSGLTKLTDTLRNEKGLVDYSLLEKEENRKKSSAAFFSDIYKKGLKLLGIQKMDSKDEFNKNWFGKAIYGINQEEIRRQLNKDFEATGFLGYLTSDEFLPKVTSNFQGYATSGIDPKYQKQILKNIKGLDELVDIEALAKRPENLQYTAGLRDIYKQKGAVTKQDIKRLNLAPYEKK